MEAGFIYMYVDTTLAVISWSYAHVIKYTSGIESCSKTVCVVVVSELYSAHRKACHNQNTASSKLDLFGSTERVKALQDTVNLEMTMICSWISLWLIRQLGLKVHLVIHSFSPHFSPKVRFYFSRGLWNIMFVSKIFLENSFGEIIGQIVDLLCWLNYQHFSLCNSINTIQ